MIITYVEVTRFGILLSHLELRNRIFFLLLKIMPKNVHMRQASEVTFSPPPPHFKKQITKELNKFNYLSVRETQGITQIKTLAGKESCVLIDPTFLVDTDTWQNIAKYDIKTPEHYILVYIMQANYNIYDHLLSIKEKYHLPILNISRYGYNPGYIDQTIIDIGPAQFLALFAKADIICTNSYHGLSFALIFRKKLYLMPCKNFSARMTNLLNVLQIAKPGENPLQPGIMKELKYDTSELNTAIDKEKNKAITYLTSFLYGGVSKITEVTRS